LDSKEKVMREGFSSARPSISKLDKNAESNPSAERRWIKGWKGEGDSLDWLLGTMEKKNKSTMLKHWTSELVVLFFIRPSLSGSTQFFNPLIKCVI